MFVRNKEPFPKIKFVDLEGRNQIGYIYANDNNEIYVSQNFRKEALFRAQTWVIERAQIKNYEN